MDAKTEETKLETPILLIRKESVVAISLGMLLALAGGIWWLSAAYASVRLNADNVKDVKSQFETQNTEISKTLQEMNTRLSRIEGALGVKKEGL